jgi:hypothetical protein
VMEKGKTIKEIFGDVDGIVAWKLDNSIGMSRYKKVGDLTVIADVIKIESDSLKDVLKDLGVDYYE